MSEAGLLSPESAEELAAQNIRLEEVVKRTGCTMQFPFITLGFMSLPVIPDLKLTDKGLFDGKLNRIPTTFATQPISKAWLFGSYSRGEETAESDVDILVSFDKEAKISLFKYADMICQLEALLKQKVDLVEDGTLLPFVISNIEEFTKELTHPSIPWIVIEKMRHVLVHGYYTILPGKVWETVQEDLPLLKHQIECLLAEE